MTMYDEWLLNHVRLTTNVYPVSRLRISGVYLHSPMSSRCEYRVFHDLWTLLQQVISYVFVIKKVHLNMCPILEGYGVMGIF